MGGRGETRGGRTGYANPNASTLRFAGNAISDAGASGLTKVTASSWRAKAATTMSMRNFLNRGKFVASVRLGTLSRLKNSVVKAGFPVRGSRTVNGTHMVVFDIPNRLL